MTQNIFFAIREMWEIIALKTIINLLNEKWYIFIFHIVVMPFNTDFNFISVHESFKDFNNVKISNKNDYLISWHKLFWFKWNIFNLDDNLITDYIDIYKVGASRLYNINKKNKNKKPLIVVTNLKVKDKDRSEEFHPDTINILWNLNANIIVIPRHPVTDKVYLNNILIQLPKNINFSNSMWKVEEFCSKADLVIMWKIFSNTLDDRDHNPLEATISSNAISWYYKYTPEVFQELYNIWLIKRLESFYEITNSLVNELVKDSLLEKKLEFKRNYILLNRENLLKECLLLFN